MRAIWKGSLSFGLVNIPINIYVGSHEREISFTLLHKKDLSEIHYARICTRENKEVPWKEIVKGYETDKGKYVVFEEKDFQKINPKKTQTVEIVNFIDEEEIDSIYYVKPYFLEPGKSGEKAYGILREAMKKSKKVGLAKFVLRNREHLGVIKCHGNMIILNQLRYETELVQPQKLKLPASKTNPKEINMALKLIDQWTVPFNPKKYKDTFVEEIKQVIKQRAKGRAVHPKKQAARSPKIHDIMSLLKDSLEEKPRKKSRKTA